MNRGSLGEDSNKDTEEVHTEAAEQMRVDGLALMVNKLLMKFIDQRQAIFARAIDVEATLLVARRSIQLLESFQKVLLNVLYIYPPPFICSVSSCSSSFSSGINRYKQCLETPAGAAIRMIFFLLFLLRKKKYYSFCRTT